MLDARLCCAASRLQKLPLANRTRLVELTCLSRSHLTRGVAALAKQTQLIAIVGVIVSVSRALANVDYRVTGRIAVG